MCGIPFEWDRRKDSANRRKHGIGSDEASTVFDDTLSITIPDPDNAIGEERFVISECPASKACWLWFILLEESGSA